ncbi:tetratricopeptide repeat protein [Candidatus Uabimicrobium sp. HlEnr_7]|uniref:tetratricopeptide repeat protein n=1 Tax=Candidatus Uabimicrobium helgolandensis TaxID=3095367 RepID=UPI003556EC00
MIKINVIFFFVCCVCVINVNANNKKIDSALYKDIEQELLRYIDPNEGAGYFKGQFRKLQEKWKEKAILPLLEIFSNKDYHYIHDHINNNEDIAFQMSLLAGEGLFDLQEVYTDTLRLQIKKTLNKKNAKSYDLLGSYRKNLTNKILYAIGDTEKFDKKLRFLLRGLHYNPGNTKWLYEIAMQYLGVGDIKNSILYFNKSIDSDPHYVFAYYNLACAYSLNNEASKGINALEKAIDNGYDNLDWLLSDGDLRGIHKHPRFEKLVKKLKKINSYK